MAISGFSGIGMYAGTIFNLRVLGYGNPRYLHMNKTEWKVTLLRCLLTSIPIVPVFFLLIVEGKKFSFYFTIFIVDFIVPTSIYLIYLSFCNTIATHTNLTNITTRLHTK